MGNLTTAQLIAEGKAESKYHLSGINSDAQWVSFFNSALKDLVEDMGLTANHPVKIASSISEYNLPDNYYSAIQMFETANGYLHPKRRNYSDFNRPGFWVLNRGDSYVMDIRQIPVGTDLTIVYQKYASELGSSESARNQEKPEVQRVGEKALIYYALQKALRNNSHLDDAKEYERLYEAERLKIRTAAARSGGSG